ncbi:Neurexin-4, partial [Fragariocoptes setiger]
MKSLGTNRLFCLSSTYIAISIYLYIACLFYSTVHTSDDTCNRPLLSQGRLTASSEFNRDRNAEAAILDGSSAWTAGQSDFSQYLVIELNKKLNISSIATQGRAYSNEYVIEYKIEYGNDGLDFAPYRDRNGNVKLFDANSDDRSVVENVFEAPIVARFLRINPTRWQDRISMRVQVFGCDYNSESLDLDGQSIYSMDLRQRPIDAVETSIKLRFRTNYANGNILYGTGTNGDLLTLQLLDNKLVLSMDLEGLGQIQNVSAGSLLDDNTWHDVSIARFGNYVLLNVDRVLVRMSFDGDFTRLNLDEDLWIGGVPGSMFSPINTRTNFTGCLENVMFNNTNVIAEMKEDVHSLLYRKLGTTIYTCQDQPSTSITFMTSESYLRVEGYQLQYMNCSFEFRTFDQDGVLLYSKFSSGGFVKLYLQDGHFFASVQGDSGPVVIIEPVDKVLNDGSWHSAQIYAKESAIFLTIDGITSRTRRKFSFQSGREYLIGGSSDPSIPGLIGCMRLVHIEGRYVMLASVSADRIHRKQASDIFFEACHLIDRCHPNPCEHGGVCRQNHREFTCDCSQTGYHGAVCHVSKHPLTCEAYRIDHPREKEANIFLDVDGSGPLEPSKVACKFITNGPSQTIIHHRSESETVVRGYEAKGSYIHSINYYAPLESIQTIINRSARCSQFIRYTCNNTRLLNSPTKPGAPFEPYSWWVGVNNQKMNYWGGSLPGSNMCACGLDGSCRDPSKNCNCDSGFYNQELTDEGPLTHKEYLPVRELRIGDTGSSMSGPKQAKIYLGPLICEGDSLFEEAITFRYEDATIALPHIDLGDACDIYLQFKTTTSSGVLLHGKGSNDFIKLTIINEKTMQFQFSTGRGPQSVTVEIVNRLNDNNWHSVLIERNQREARLVVDGQLSSQVPLRADVIRPVQLTSNLFIGATTDFKEGFVGCMRGLLINGRSINIYSHAREGNYGLLPGCHGQCESNPCLNKGTCREGYSSFTCDCQYTAFKGPICADEIGVNLRSDNYVKYDLDSSISTVEESVRVGFTTTEHKGLVLGVTAHTGEYLNLLMSTSGHLRLEFDFGFERKEEIINHENFALGQHHDLTIKRMTQGSKMVVYVDNYEPRVYEYKISKDADAKFDQIKSIYLGRNETMDSGDGFVGCISRVSFDDHFPLRYLFQENRRANVHAYPSDESVHEDTCGIEPVRPPPEKIHTRPALSSTPGGAGGKSSTQGSRFIAIASYMTGVTLVVILLAAIIVFYVTGRILTRDQGDYVTHEDIGAKDALNPDMAVMMGVTGPIVSKKKEYFI